MEKKIPIKTLYLLLVISLGLVGLGIGSTYAVFTTSAEISSPISLGSDLSYSSDIIETVSVTVESGKTVSTTLNVTNSSDSTLNYATWYMDDGLDVEVVTESGSSQGTIASGGSASVVVSVRNYTSESASVDLGISSSNDSVVLGSDMKRAQDVNFLMSVSEDETVSATTNFLSSSLTRNQISSITFVDNNTVPSGYTSADVSKYGDGSVLMWYGAANSSGYYDVYIGSSSGTTYIDSGYYLFSYLSKCTAINLNNLVDVSKSIDMAYMFYNSSALTTVDVSGWDVSNVKKMNAMFYNCGNLANLDVSNWNTGNVTTMRVMFALCSKLNQLDVSNWNTRYVTDLTGMFQVCISIETLDLSNWDVSNVTSTYGMFLSVPSYGEMALTSIGNVSNWNTGSVTDMSAMFQYCTNLEFIDVSNWDVSKVTSMQAMFSDCHSLKTIDVSNWNISSLTSTRGMFGYCFSIIELDLSGWDTSNVTTMRGMFEQCTALKTIYVSDSWSTSSVTDSTNMFINCTSLVGGSGTAYSASYLDATYAKIDGGTSSPGYFTSKA